MENEIVNGTEPGSVAPVTETPEAPRPAFPVWVPAVFGAVVLGLAGGWYLRGSGSDSRPAGIIPTKATVASAVVPEAAIKKEAPPSPTLPVAKPMQTVGPPPPDSVADTSPKGGKMPSGMPLPGLTGSVAPMQPGQIVPGPGAAGISEQAIRGIAESNGGRLTSSLPNGNGRVYTVETTAGKATVLSKRLRDAVGLQGVVGDPIYPEETNAEESESIRALTKRLLDTRKRHAELLVAFYADAPSVKDCEREIADIEKLIEKVKNTPPKPGTKVSLQVTIRE